MKKYPNFETNAIRTRLKRTDNKEHSTPIYATSSFLFDSAEEAGAVFANEQDGYIYSRLSNPNNDEFINKLCQLEGTEAGLATASGMSAVYASLAAFLRPGDHILCNSNLFASTYQIITQILSRWAISHTFLDADDMDNWEEYIQPSTRLMYLETPSNPAMDIIDLEKAGKIAQDNDLLLIVDNCFATPYLQNPAKWGAHLVCHSATKFIDGQGRVLGGAVLGEQRFIDELTMFARQTGPTLSPFNSWILSKSLETLAVRMEKHSDNALNLAKFLQNHPSIAEVKYPFLEDNKYYALAKKQMRLGGGMLTFDIKGGLKSGRKFINALEMLSVTANLGDTRTTITHPASTTHSRLTPEEREDSGISDGLIRVSVGLEHIDDILADIKHALDKL